MKVAELIGKLQMLPKDLEVLLKYESFMCCTPTVGLQKDIKQPSRDVVVLSDDEGDEGVRCDPKSLITAAHQSASTAFVE